MQIEMPGRELGELAEAAGDGQPRHRMLAQIFERAADEIAHVDQRHLRQIVHRLAPPSSEVEPVDAARCVSPAARATSMPRWIEWIHAAQENGTTMPVVPRIEMPADDAEPRVERLRRQRLAIRAPTTVTTTSAGAADMIGRVGDRARDHRARAGIDRRLARRQRQARRA